MISTTGAARAAMVLLATGAGSGSGVTARGGLLGFVQMLAMPAG